MEASMKIDLDKLPIKRLGAIEESGIEHFPPDTDYEEKRLDAIRRIDFSWVVERDSKKLKTSEEEAAAPSATPPVWPWQGLVENLKVAHEELSVIIDIINTVEANDAVTVAGMQRPKQLPNEVLSDLAVSAATKLQRLRHLGRYFKQSSKALEQQVAREARFYGSLIRLQHNWKTKRQRLGASGPGSEGFIIDLQDNSSSDLLAFSHLSTLSMVRVEQDSAGILAVQLPQKSCRSIFLRFLGAHPSSKQRSFLKRKIYGSGEHPREAKKEALSDEDVNARVKESHSILREIHRSIFQEQIFDMVSGEAHNPSPGVNVTGMREDFLQLAIGQETSVCLCLEPSVKEDDTQTVDSTGQTPDEDNDPLGLTIIDEKQDPLKRISLARPNPVSLEIYLQYIFHESVLVRAKGKHPAATRLQVSSQPTTDGCGLLGHFSLTVAHRIFSSKVLSVLEQLVNGVPYLHLLSHPTWHCRTSSWSLSLKVPQSIFHAGAQIKTLDTHDVKSGYRSQYHTKILVNDDQISVSGEGAPSIIDSFRGTSADVCSINSYGCILEDLPMVILQQVASQVIHWLHEEAMLVGMKANKDFLGLYFDLDLGETLGLVAHVNPGDTEGCISWWLVMEDDGSPEKEKKLSTEENSGEGANRRYLGHLSLQALYSMMMDLVTLCSTGGTR